MSVFSKDIVQEIIQENDFKSPGEVVTFLKEAFRDFLQEMLEADKGFCKGF